jgi:hypothetical protein
MGFFDDTFNWLWQGILVNLFSTIFLSIILFMVGFALFSFTRYLVEEVLSGMFTKKQDEPIQVILLCLFGPIFLISGIGIVIGIFIGFFDIFILFFKNILPFVDWGEKDGLLVWDYVFTDLIGVPYFLLLMIHKYIFIWPLLTILVLLVMCYLILGHLWPSGNNAGSFSDSQMQYASMSFATLFMFFALVVSISFEGMLQHIMDLETLEKDSDEYQEDGIELWQDMDEPKFAESVWKEGYVMRAETQDVVLLRCNSVDVRSDGFDEYVYAEKLLVMISAASEFTIVGSPGGNPMNNDSKVQEFVVEPYIWFDGTQSDESSFYVQPGNLEQQGEFINETGSYSGGNDDWDFHMSSKNDLSTKYHIAWIIAENGSTNETSKALAKALSDAGDPTECGQYALLGSLEGRVRVASLSLVFGAIFTMGCMIHRFYIISGIHGSTDVSVLSRTFVFSLWGSGLFFSSFIAFFDPFDGTGITGITAEKVVDIGDSMLRLIIMGSLIIMSLVVIIAMYRQRSIIGNLVDARKNKRDDKADLEEVRRRLDEL